MVDFAMLRSAESNPWDRLTKAGGLCFCLDDKEKLDQISKRIRKPEYQLRLEVLPEPFIGCPDAKIWVLNLNPGFHVDDLQHGEVTKKRQLENLLLKADCLWYLHKEHSTTRGYAYWRKRFKSLICRFGAGAVSRNVFCLEFFPYHSTKFKRIPSKLIGALPSQAFSAALLRAGILQKKYLIAFRHIDPWCTLVPELAGSGYKMTNSSRNPTISPRNFSDFDGVCQIIESEERRRPE